MQDLRQERPSFETHDRFCWKTPRRIETLLSVKGTGNSIGHDRRKDNIYKYPLVVSRCPFLHAYKTPIKLVLTLYLPVTHIRIMSSHKNLYGGLILGVNTLYKLFCFVKPFPMVSKGLKENRRFETWRVPQTRLFMAVPLPRRIHSIAIPLPKEDDVITGRHGGMLLPPFKLIIVPGHGLSGRKLCCINSAGSFLLHGLELCQHCGPNSLSNTDCIICVCESVVYNIVSRSFHGNPENLWPI